MNQEKQALYNISQNVANLRNTLFSGCVISNQSQQQLALINIQAQNELITNAVIKEQIVNFVNNFGALLNDCSQQANVNKQTLVNDIQRIILNYYNSLVPLVWTRYVFIRPIRRYHNHDGENN